MAIRLRPSVIEPASHEPAKPLPAPAPAPAQALPAPDIAPPKPLMTKGFDRQEYHKAYMKTYMRDYMKTRRDKLKALKKQALNHGQWSLL